jgi:hypothetical protein
MTTKEAKQAGEKHASHGKKLTPYECQNFDAQIFMICRKSERPAKEYNKLRGAFNRGWQERYFSMVSEVAL